MPVLPGTPPIDISLRRSARARRFSLRVSRLDGRVTLSMPIRAKESDALRFANEQADWIRNALATMPSFQVISPGDYLPVEGRQLVLTLGSGRSVRVEGESLVVPGDAALVGTRAAAFLKVLARDRLARACDHHSTRLGRRYTRLTLRDTRSRWGSCAHDGALMFSWRLVMAPPEVLDYVAAHEVAHLVEMNHSAEFWHVVEGLCPQWKRHRAWLHTHGQSLHALRFENRSEDDD